MSSSLRPERDTYHHGDLRNALVSAGVALAERGGPDAIGVRSVAREVGVTPTAAYRHFANADELRDAIKERCLEVLVAAMRAELALVETTDDPAENVVRKLKALGRGYVRMAYADPGYFTTAFGDEGAVSQAGRPPRDATGFSMLGDVLDELVVVGYLPAERRPYADFAAWAGAHGLARLIVDGPLAAVPDDERDAIVERTLDMIVSGL